MRDAEVMAAFAAFSLIISLVVFAIIVATYVLAAVGIYGMAKKKDIENAWLAWIPIANYYILGKVIGPAKIDKIEINNTEVVLPLAQLAVFGISVMPVIKIIATPLNIIFSACVVYTLYKMYHEEVSIPMIIIWTLFTPIFLFTLRDKEAIRAANEDVSSNSQQYNSQDPMNM